jgi:hypothetical protein
MKTTRKELFDKAWEIPMTKLALEFGCSDVGLRKACVKNQIPLPPQGHWQKLSYGKGFTKPDLPLPDFNPEIAIDPRAVKTAKQAHEESIEMEEAVKTIANPRIKPDTELKNVHPLIEATLKVAKDYQRRIGIARTNPHYSYYQRNSDDRPPHDDNGRLNYSPWNGCISITASFTALDRSLRILNPLFKALELSGFDISIPHAERWDPKVMVFEKSGEKLQIHVREVYSRISISPKNRSIAAKFGIDCRERENFANGQLNIEIKINDIYQSQTFKDLRKVSLEDQMDLILQYMLDGPQKAKDKRAAQEKEENERRDRQAIRNFNDNILKSQKRQYTKALEEVNLYKQLQDLKDYIGILQTQMSGLSKQEKKLANFWISIVQEYAKEADPITNHINLIRKIANEPEDEYENYWCKKSKPYTPHEEDQWEDEYEDY